MDNLQLKISLPGTDPLVWREVVVHPNTDLEDMHDVLQAVMNWDDCHMHLFRDSRNRMFDPEQDAYYDVALGGLLPRKGSKLWYVYDFGDNWEHLIEVVGRVPEKDRKTPYLTGGANAAPPEDSGGIPGYQYKLSILADPTHPDYEETLGWLTGVYDDPFDPRFFDLEDTALYLRECMEGLLDELLDIYDEDAFSEEMTFLDIDLGRERKINFEWLRKEHGIPLTEDHIRRAPKEVIDFLEMAEAEDDPTPFVEEAKRLYSKYPGEPRIYLALQAMYQFLGKEVLASRISKNIPDISPDDVLFNLGFIMESFDEETFVKRVSQMPQPLKLTNLPPGKGGLYHVDEFHLFEELAIRYALAEKNLEEAVARLDRLVCAGFLHSDLRSLAMMIAGFQITVVQELLAKHKAQPDLPVPPPSKPVSERTQEILDQSMQDVLQLIRGDALEEVDDRSGGRDDDYPELSLAHSARKPQQPYIAEKKVGRNDPCPCGSGKKYKKCCG